MKENSTIPEWDSKSLEIAEEIKRALLEIHVYQSSHTPDEFNGNDVERLIGIGAISFQTAGFLQNYQTRFHGFPKRISQDIAVLDVLLADGATLTRFVGYANGHVQRI